MNCEEILARLAAQANPENVAGMARFGINPKNTYGISIPTLRKLARSIGHDHLLAQELWASGMHEARILAAYVDEPARVTRAQMERWVRDLDSWDVCDQVCLNLFDKTPLAWAKACEWSRRKGEFEKRAGFALMAALAWHDAKAPNAVFTQFLPLIKQGALDERNYVKKAVSWALRQIGKRNRALNRLAIRTARELQALDSKPARWVGMEAERELLSMDTLEHVG